MGKKRLTQVDYRRAAEKHGFAFVGVVPSDNHAKTHWRCPNGHFFETCYTVVASGFGCAYCSGCARKTKLDYDVAARNRGFEFIGKVPKNVMTKTLWRCAQGHEWESRYADISRYGCPYCANRPPIGIEDYHALAERRRFLFVGDLPKNTHERALWQCENGHEWQGLYTDIDQGAGCPVCANRVPKTAEDYHNLATQRGFSFTGSVPKDTSRNTEWTCALGHRWTTTYSAIKSGNGCPHCAGLAPKTLADFNAMASQYGFKFIDDFPDGVYVKVWWECAQGHQWKATYSSIQQGHGCHFCLAMVNGQRVSKPQLVLHDMLGGTVNLKVKRYAIDVALDINGVKIALEYDCAFWHSPARDAKRDAYLISLGWHMLRVKSGTLLPTREQLDTAIAELVNGATYAEIVLPDWRGG